MWPLIISIFEPIAAAWVTSNCGKDPVDGLKAAYKHQTDSFRPSAVKRATHQMHRAILLARPQMTPEQLSEADSLTIADIRQKAIEQMRAGLTATPEHVAACLARAATLPNLDHDDDGEE